MLNAALFPTLGGIATGLWLENVAAGVVGYYALLTLALLSPEGAGLRNGVGRRLSAVKSPVVADEAPAVAAVSEPTALIA